jgi:hypothetical protein
MRRRLQKNECRIRILWWKMFLIREVPKQKKDQRQHTDGVKKGDAVKGFKEYHSVHE